MKLQVIVTNITNFGAFVDVGIKEYGLIYISNLSYKFISNPVDVVSVYQHVSVQVLENDQIRKRVQLKLKSFK